MNQVYLDTSGLIAIVNTDDRWHTKAESVWANLLSSAVSHVTSSLVLIELADGLSRVQHRPLALQIIDALRNSKRIKIVQSHISLECPLSVLLRLL